MTLGDSGYCLGGYNAKSIDKSSFGIILISWFLFSQWLPIGQKCRKTQKSDIARAPPFFAQKYMVFWAKSLIIVYGIRFGGGRVEILTSPIITPPYLMVLTRVMVFNPCYSVACVVMFSCVCC